MKTINIKYDVGDNIKYIHRIHKDIMDECPCCGGTGQIIGVDGKWYECGECEGSGKIYSGKQEIIESIEEGTICDVHAHYDSNVLPKMDKAIIYYRTPHNTKKIMEEDIIERIVSE